MFLLNDLLPAIMLLCLVLGVALEISGHDGPVRLFLQFFIVAFGPSLIYALVSDKSDLTLFAISMFFATGLGVFGFWRRSRRSGGADE